jgi:hypothetical protein
MVTHFLLLILTACQVLLITAEINKYSRTQERFIYNMFIDNSDKRDIDFKRFSYLFTIDEIRNQLKYSLDNFYNLRSKSLEKVEYPAVMYSIMELNYIDNANTHNNIEKPLYYKIDNTTLGPFDLTNDEVKVFLNDVTQFRLNYTFMTYVPFSYTNNYDCNVWDIDQYFDFTSRAHFICSIDIVRKSCGNESYDITYWDTFINKLLWIHVLVVIVAFISLYFSWDYIQNLASHYMRAKTKHRAIQVKFILNI